MSNTAATKLEGRVASILNAQEVAINLGSEAGVRVGQKFAIVAQTPLEIKDPESGDVLDILEREKVRVEAYRIRPKISVCRTYRTSLPRKSSIAHILADLGSGAIPVTEQFQIARETNVTPLPPDDNYVKINDRVIAVNENE